MIRAALSGLALSLLAGSAMANPPIPFTWRVLPEASNETVWDGVDAAQQTIDSLNPTPNSLSSWNDELVMGGSGRGGSSFVAAEQFAGWLAPNGDGSTSTLTIRAGAATAISVGDIISGTGMTPGTRVISGGGNSWQVTNSQTLGSSSDTNHTLFQTNFSQEPVAVPNVGVQLYSNTYLLHSLFPDYSARTMNHGLMFLGQLDCAAGANTNGQSLIFGINGASGNLSSRQPSFEVNTGSNSSSGTTVPACTIELDYRSSAGYNRVVGTLQSGLHWYSIVQGMNAAHIPFMIVNGVVSYGSTPGTMPYPKSGEHGQLGGGGGYGQPVLVNVFGLLNDIGAEFTLDTACKQDWELRQRLLAAQAARPDLVPSTEPALMAGPVCSAYASAPATVSPASVQLATRPVSVQFADPIALNTTSALGAVGTPIPPLGARHLAWSFIPTGNVINDVKSDFRIGTLPTSSGGYFGSLYSSTQSPTPQNAPNGMQLLEYGTGDITPSVNCTEPTDPTTGKPVLRMGSQRTGTNPNFTMDECGIASANVADQGYELPYGGRTTLTFRYSYPNNSTNYIKPPGYVNSSGYMDPCVVSQGNLTSVVLSNWHTAPFELYVNLVSHQDRHRPEVDSTESYSSNELQQYSGLSAHILYHYPTVYVTPTQQQQFGEAGGYGAQNNANFREGRPNPLVPACTGGDPGFFAPWSNLPSTVIDPGTGYPTGFFAPSLSITSPWHTWTFDEVVSTNQLCQYLDGYEVNCSTMPPEFKTAPAIILSADYPFIIEAGDSGFFYMDVQSIQAWNPN